jgi:hypothetical protein
MDANRGEYATKPQRWEGSRPRDPLFSKPTTDPIQR